MSVPIWHHCNASSQTFGIPRPCMHCHASAASRVPIEPEHGHKLALIASAPSLHALESKCVHTPVPASATARTCACKARNGQEISTDTLKTICNTSYRTFDPLMVCRAVGRLFAVIFASECGVATLCAREWRCNSAATFVFDSTLPQRSNIELTA